MLTAPAHSRSSRSIRRHGLPRRDGSIPGGNELLTVAEVAELLKCKPSSIYDLTRSGGRARHDTPIPVLRLPMGLRFRRSSILAGLKTQETTAAQVGIYARMSQQIGQYIRTRTDHRPLHVAK
jgi:hypothetical protein